MQIEKLSGIVRALLEPERRAIRRSIERCRHRLNAAVRNTALFGAGCFVVTSAVIALDRKAIAPPFAIAIWFVICALMSVWGAFGATRDLKKRIARLKRTLQRNEAREVTIQSTEMVEFEEEEDEGACYAFQLSDG